MRQIDEITHTLGGLAALSTKPTTYFMSLTILTLLFLMKCYKHLLLKKY